MPEGEENPDYMILGLLALQELENLRQWGG